MDPEVLHFFASMPQALPLYEAVVGQVMELFPQAKTKVQKTQISFANKYGFACVSLPIRKIRGRPAVYIIVTFGLGRRVEHPRIERSVEPYPGRWTHHVLVSRAEDVDDTLLAWLQEAYAFALYK